MPFYIALLGLRIFMVISICNLVHEAIETGYLSVTAENKLRTLLRSKYSEEELRAFIELQLAAMNGLVKLESHELFCVNNTLKK